MTPAQFAVTVVASLVGVVAFLGVDRVLTWWHKRVWWHLDDVSRLCVYVGAMLVAVGVCVELDGLPIGQVPRTVAATVGIVLWFATLTRVLRSTRRLWRRYRHHGRHA